MEVLVAGIGNLFFGDDGFGGEVVRRLERTPLPEGVQVRSMIPSGRSPGHEAEPAAVA